jgi:hypothetical protein
VSAGTAIRATSLLHLRQSSMDAESAGLHAEDLIEATDVASRSRIRNLTFASAPEVLRLRA